MTNKTTSCFVIFFIFTFFQTPALSSDLKFITLRVAPWAYHNDKGELVGLFSDFVRELEVKTGYNIDIALASPGFARINRELEAGRQDCTMTIRDLERDRFTILGAQILDLEMGVVAKKGLQLNQYQDLLSMKVSIYQVLNDNKVILDDERIQVEVDKSYLAGLMKMQHGRLDAIAGPISKIRFLADKNNMSSLLGQSIVLKKEAIYLQCSQKSIKPEHMDVLNKAIKEIQGEDVYRQLIKQYH